MSNNVRKNYLLIKQLHEQANIINIIRDLPWYCRILPIMGFIIPTLCLIFWNKFNLSGKEFMLVMVAWYILYKFVIYYAAIKDFSTKLNLDQEFTEYIAQQCIFNIPNFKDYKYIVFILKGIFRSWVGLRGLYYIFLLKNYNISYVDANIVVQKLNQEISIKRFDALSNPGYLLITGVFLAFCSGVFGAIFTSIFAYMPSSGRDVYLMYFSHTSPLFVFAIIAMFIITRILPFIETDEKKLKELTLFIFWYELLEE
ncbi:MAG: hypothetical protein PHC75_02465 [Burkholderiales bacterium]|nr:hypothetical protein [Burkholderiales bacterium]